MSKNNQQEQIKRMSNYQQHFALRKLSVGVASVLVGLTFIWGGQHALADQIQQSSDGDASDTHAATDTQGIANQNSQVTLHSTASEGYNNSSSSTSSENPTSTSTASETTTLNTQDEHTSTTPSEVTTLLSSQPAADTAASQYNVSDWNIAADNTITLKNAPAAGSTVYVPNSVDFGHEVVLTADYIKQLGQLGVSELYIDSKQNGKVMAANGDWSYAFANRTWKKLDLGSLDTSNVTNMTGLFQGATDLVSVGDIDQWNTSNVTDMHGLFAGTNNLTADNGTLDLHDWDTSKVIAMNSMFDGSSSLKKIDVHGWNVSNVIGVNGVGNDGLDMMFRCSVPIGGSTLAYTPSKLETVDISGWSNPDKLTDIGRMFMFDRNLQEVKGINEWLSRPNNIQTMGQMFRGCTKLQRLDLSKWNVSSLTSMGVAFSECSSLQSLGDLSHWDTHNLQDLGSTFKDTTNFNDPVTLNSFSHWNVDNLGSLNSTFMNSGITKLDLSNWHPHLIGTGLVFSFLNCKNLTSLGDLSHWDTHEVTNMGAAFRGTSKLTDQRTADGIATWDVSNNTNFNQMFQNCGLQILDLHQWDTSKGTGFERTFAGSGVKNLDISGWDFSKGVFDVYAPARAVASLVFNLVNPALITMNDVTLPTDTNSFKVTDFGLCPYNWCKF